MSQAREKLKELQEKVARKGRLESRLCELRDRRQELESKMTDLKLLADAEQEDVDRLGKGSLASFFYHVIGRMDEKLTKEREEAHAARVRYHAALREFNAVTEDLERVQRDLDGLAGCEREYERALQERAETLKATGGQTGAGITRLEKELVELERRRQELKEAYTAGHIAMDTANEVFDLLSSAESWGTWDVFGGGLVADLAKYEKLDAAQGGVEELQIQLRRMRAELADVALYIDIDLQMDGFLRFADYFFDSIFADWAALDRIRNALGQVEEVRWQIGKALHTLEGLTGETVNTIARKEKELDDLICSAE